MRNSYSFVLALFIAVLSCGFVKADAVLPANLEMPDYLVPVVAQLYAQSATFRSQCDRIADMPRVQVSVRLDVNMRSSCRAFSIITHRRGALFAEVHVPPGRTLLAEFIAHELEHVLVQTEHLDLRRLARVRNSGVHDVEAALFETERAQRIGKVVAEELRLHHEARRSTD